MKPTLLISGCSHAAGSEIDGTQDSKFNRSHSFGAKLADKLGYTPVNIAMTGATNSGIARSVLEWFDTQYTTGTEVFVLVAWTESSRLEVPMARNYPYHRSNPSADWFSNSAKNYMRVNMGYPGGDLEERKLVPYYQEFVARDLNYLELQGANYVLQLEYFLKMKKIEYAMCNTMDMFTQTPHLDFYLNKIDKTRFMDLGSRGFYWKYKEAGYQQQNSKYWHHNEMPHSLYAEELYNFIQQR